MRPRPDRRRVAALALVLFVAAACSSPQGTQQPENSLLGKGKDRAGTDGGKGAGKKDGGKPGGSNKPGGAANPAAAAPGAGIPSPDVPGKGIDTSSKTKTEIASQGQDPATASVEITEPNPDAEKSGVAPQSADIVSTKVEGVGPDLRVTIAFHGDVPQKMPDGNTYMVIGFGMTPPEDSEEQGYAFGASADDKGWTTYGGGKRGGKYPGEFSLSGDVAVFTIPWSALDGPRAFDWYSQTSWFRSLAGTTHYSLDALPNEGPAKYPAG